MPNRKAFAMGFQWIRTGTDDYRELRLLTVAQVKYDGTNAENFDTINSSQQSIYTVGSGDARDRQGVLDEMYSLFNGVESHYHFRLVYRHGTIYWNGADYPSVQNAVETLTGYSAPTDLILSTQSPTLDAVVKDSASAESGTKDPDNHFPSVCNNSTLVHLRWDEGTDELLVINDYGEGTVETAIATGITSQALLQSTLEAIYPDDDYTFAYHVNSGQICVEWEQYDSGNGGFTFSVDLQENIIIDDDVTAHVIRGYEKSFGKWTK